MTCTLCNCPDCRLIFTNIKNRAYFLCPSCDLVFADPNSWLSSLDEKNRYTKHTNDLKQTGYFDFLNQMWVPLKSKLKAGSEGLDFGCGPSRAFAEMAAQDGLQVECFDPYFFNDRSLLEKNYDFVWCSEVFEHFYSPTAMLGVLDHILKPNAVLAVMTEACVPIDKFSDWYYKNDETHVSFYSEKTMQWIAKSRGWAIETISQRVTFFTKLARTPTVT